jgi:hypothetical protein
MSLQPKQKIRAELLEKNFSLLNLAISKLQDEIERIRTS